MTKDLAGALGTLNRNLELLEVTMENLAELVMELEDFLIIADNIMASALARVTSSRADVTWSF